MPHSFERKDFHEKCSGVLATSESKGAGDAAQRTSSITIRRLAATRRNLAAAPGYLDVHSSPSSIDELANPSGNASRSARLEEFAQFMHEVGKLLRNVRVACGALWTLVCGYWHLMVSTLGAAYCAYTVD